MKRLFATLNYYGDAKTRLDIETELGEALALNIDFDVYTIHAIEDGEEETETSDE